MDSAKANQMFVSLAKQYPSSLLNRFASVEMTINPDYSSQKASPSTAHSVDDVAGLKNYPNPFNPTTTISYNLPASGHVTLKVYDILGREVVTLTSENQSAGAHSAIFDGTHFARGVYFYRLIAPGVAQVKKMLMTK